MLRTGRSRSVALHPALLRRSYGSIPHDSSPHRSGLPPLHLPAYLRRTRGRASRRPAKPWKRGRPSRFPASLLAHGFSAGRDAPAPRPARRAPLQFRACRPLWLGPNIPSILPHRFLRSVKHYTNSRTATDRQPPQVCYDLEHENKVKQLQFRRPQFIDRATISK